MKKKQRSYVGIVVILIVIAAAAGLITTLIGRRMPSKERADISEYFSIANESDIGLTVDGIVTSPLKTIGGTVCAPFSLVKEALNERFYYDENEGILTVTTPTLWQNFTIDELIGNGSVILVPGAGTETGDAGKDGEDSEEGETGEDGAGGLFPASDELCLSLPFIETWTDMEITADTAGISRGSDVAVLAEGGAFAGTDADEASAGTDADEGSGTVPHIAVRRTFPYEEASLSADAKVRTRPTIKAPILYDGTAGDTVELVVTEDTADGWTCVMTKDGLSGYVESDAVGEPAQKGADHTSAIGSYTSMALGEKVNLVFYPTNNETTNGWIPELLAGTDGVNVIAPTWFFLEGQGQVTSFCDKAVVDACHNAGIKVWALINDIDGNVHDSSATAEVLKSTSSRQAIVNTIVEETIAAGVDGLNVDIEHVSQEAVDAYLTFIRELSAECRTKGLFLTIDTYVPMAYSKYLNRHEMGVVADYVIIMCYDEHYSGSEEAGSVSSLPFLKQGLENSKKEIPAEKIVAAIPFYTRLWSTRDSGAPGSEVMSMAKALTYAAENDMEIFWDEDVSQHVAEKTEDGVLYQIWLEDADSIAAKAEAIREADVAGAAEWCLGNETPDVWPVLKEALFD